jgi:hypothetical protein
MPWDSPEDFHRFLAEDLEGQRKKRQHHDLPPKPAEPQRADPGWPYEMTRDLRAVGATIERAADTAREAAKGHLDSDRRAAELQNAQLRAVVAANLRVAGDALAQAAQSAKDMGLAEHAEIERLGASVDALREKV